MVVCPCSQSKELAAERIPPVTVEGVTQRRRGFTSRFRAVFITFNFWCNGVWTDGDRVRVMLIRPI